MQRAGDLANERAVTAGGNDRVDGAIAVMGNDLYSEPAKFIAGGLAEAPPPARVGIDRQKTRTSLGAAREQKHAFDGRPKADRRESHNPASIAKYPK